MRNLRIATGEYYHIYNRGVHKQTIFSNTRDYSRFLLLLTCFQYEFPIYNLSRYVDHYVKHSVFNIGDGIEKTKRYVELTSFCLMPNHFHVLVSEKVDGGIAKYMQRVLNAYTKYFNTKYDKNGHLFQGPYGAIHVKDNRQLLYLSAYIHRNPRELPGWKNKEHKYRWSSLQDYIEENRWGDLLRQDIILNQFEGKKEYKHFVDTSPAKVLGEHFEFE